MLNIRTGDYMARFKVMVAVGHPVYRQYSEIIEATDVEEAEYKAKKIFASVYPVYSAWFRVYVFGKIDWEV
jgi:hypothetical protein